jgi:hypothetical protein
VPSARFSLAALIGGVTVCAVLFAALQSGSNDWFKTVYSVTFLLLLYAAIAARYRGPFWYGFAIVGWAYFLVGFGNWIGAGFGHETTNRHVISAVILEAVSGTIATRDPPPPGIPPLASMNNWTEIRRQNREGICHSALTLIFAIVGGVLARRMARQSPAPLPPTPDR